MPQYRFSPQRPQRMFWAVTGFLVILLGTPALLAVALPTDTQTEPEEVVISGPMSEWKTSVPGLECEPDPMAITMNGWYCDDLYIQGAQTIDVDDDALALQRGVRAYQMAEMPEGEVYEDNGTFALYDAPSRTLAFSFPHQQDNIDQQVFLTGSPESILPVAEDIWDTFTDDQLPEAVVKELP